MKKIREIPGYDEEITSKCNLTTVEDSESRYFRFTGDKRRFLWDKGRECLAVVDALTLEFVDYKRFWEYPDTNRLRPIKPGFAIGNKDCSKIFAVGYEGTNLVLIFHKHRSERSYKAPSAALQKEISTWLCAESYTRDEVFFVGGMQSDSATIGAIDFNEGLNPKSFLKLSKFKSKSVGKLKRIEGSDIVLAGMSQDIVVTRYENSNFSLLHSFNTYCESEICGLIFHTQYIYSLTLDEGSLHVIEFKNPINQEEYSTTENKELPVLDIKELQRGAIGNATSVNGDLNLTNDADIASYLANEQIAYANVMEEEDKLLSRLKNAKVVKRKANSSPILRLAPSLMERSIYAMTDKGVDIYKVDHNDLPFSHSIDKLNLHSLFSVGILMVMQEHLTNNVKVYNNGSLIWNVKGLGPSPAKRRFR